MVGGNSGTASASECEQIGIELHSFVNDKEIDEAEGRRENELLNLVSVRRFVFMLNCCSLG